MPSVKRTGVKAVAQSTGFESYDGAEPTKRGMYRARIAQLNFKQFKTGSQGFSLQVVLEAASGDPKNHAQYDGYPQWSNLVFGDKEQMLIRESNFYAALGLKDGPNIVFEEGDLEDGVAIKTLGGKSLDAIRKLFINVDLKPRRDGQDGLEVDGIYKLKEQGASAKASAPVASDDEEADDEEPMEDAPEDDEEAEADEEETQTREERAEELSDKAVTLADLRKLAKEDYDIKTVGLKRDALIEAILDYEYPDGDEEADDEEEPEDDEEEAEEEAEEEEGDERSEREAELADLDRPKLKTILKKLEPKFVVRTSTTDDALREAIIASEFGDEAPF